MSERLDESNSYCKSREEINAKLEGSYIYVLTNQIRFDSTKYHSDSVSKESVFSWLPLSTEISTRETFRVSKTEIELQDLFVDLDQVTVFESSYLFDLR